MKEKELTRAGWSRERCSHRRQDNLARSTEHGSVIIARSRRAEEARGAWTVGARRRTTIRGLIHAAVRRHNKWAFTGVAARHQAGTSHVVGDWWCVER